MCRFFLKEIQIQRLSSFGSSQAMQRLEGGAAMDLDDLIIAWFCRIDEGLQTLLAGKHRRERGPHPILADSEVLTMEVVGEYLGREQDSAILSYFRRHYRHFFPALADIHRPTFVRQPANLQVIKEWLWQWLRDQIPRDPQLAIVASVALPVCQFTRAPRAVSGARQPTAMIT
jgi:hypothetical protein